MKERLEIRNFGPVKLLDIEIKPLTLFIGTQGSGKSTIAKLLTIFRDLHWYIQVLEEQDIFKPFIDFNIDEYFHSDSYFHYQNEAFTLSFDNGKFDIRRTDMSNEETKKFIKEFFENSNKNLTNRGFFDAQDIIDNNIIKANKKMMLYIPAERNLIGNLSSALASIMLARIPLSETIIEYMSLFEKAKKEFPKYEIPFLGVRYEKKEGKERIVVSEDGKDLPLSACSSGLQSVLPMIMVIDYALSKESFDSFVIEEPEQNLFPENQRELLNFICKKQNNEHFEQCIITTHSPYLLSCLNVLMLAAKLHKNEDCKEKVEAIVSKEYMVNSSDVAIYGLYPIGTSEDYCKSLIAERTGLISINELDSVSESIGEDYDSLYHLYLQTRKKK